MSTDRSVRLHHDKSDKTSKALLSSAGFAGFMTGEEHDIMTDVFSFERSDRRFPQRCCRYGV